MTSSRPYLVRALYEWIVDNSCTPYILVDATQPDTQVPRQHVQNGQIVLNISPTAVVGLQIDNGELNCSARFGGVPMQLRVPMGALLGIYARENGQGMVFEAEPEPPAPTPRGVDQKGGKTGGEQGGDKRGGKAPRPSLKVVK